MLAPKILMRTYIFLIIFLVVSLVAEAKNSASIFKHCEPLPINTETIDFSLLNDKEKSLIIIHNLSETNLWLILHGSDKATNENLSSKLTSNKWSALLLVDHRVLLHCIESFPGHEQHIPCAGQIFLCKWSAPIKIKERKNFWIGENMNKTNLIEYLSSRGFA